MPVYLDEKEREAYHYGNRQGKIWTTVHVSCQNCDSYNCLSMTSPRAARTRLVKQCKMVGWRIFNRKWICAKCAKNLV